MIDKYGQDKADALKKMVVNKSADRKQFERYKDVLGKDAPQTLDKFQNLKYNDSDGWKALKRLT